MRGACYLVCYNFATLQHARCNLLSKNRLQKLCEDPFRQTSNDSFVS